MIGVVYAIGVPFSNADGNPKRGIGKVSASCIPDAKVDQIFCTVTI